MYLLSGFWREMKDRIGGKQRETAAGDWERTTAAARLLIMRREREVGGFMARVRVWI